MEKFLTVAELKSLFNKSVDGEISFSKMVEEINYKAYIHYHKIKEISDRCSLTHIQTTTSNEISEKWFRKDRLLYIEKFGDKFRILPNTTDATKIGSIDFKNLYFDDFEQVALKINNIYINKYE